MGVISRRQLVGVWDVECQMEGKPVTTLIHVLGQLMGVLLGQKCFEGRKKIDLVIEITNQIIEEVDPCN